MITEYIVIGAPAVLWLASWLLERRLPPLPPLSPQDAPDLGEAIGAVASVAAGVAGLCWALVGVAVSLSPVLLLAWVVLR